MVRVVLESLRKAHCGNVCFANLGKAGAALEKMRDKYGGNILSAYDNGKNCGLLCFCSKELLEGAPGEFVQYPAIVDENDRNDVDKTLCLVCMRMAKIRSGAGSQLVRTWFDWARANKFRKLEIVSVRNDRLPEDACEVHRAGHRVFWESLGFKFAGLVPKDVIPNTVIMKLDIGALTDLSPAYDGRAQLLHENAVVRSWAVWKFYEKHGGDAAESLLALLNDSEAFVAKAAGDALACIGDPVVPMLLECMKAGGNQRRLAIHALGKIGHKEETRQVTDLLNDGDLQTRIEAVRTLHLMRYKPASEKILSLLKEEADETFRHIAIRALSVLGSEKESHQLSRLLNRASDEEKILILRALGEIGQEADVPLITPLVKSENKMVKLEAVGALANIASPSCFDLFVNLLRDQDTGTHWSSVRSRAAMGLGRIGDVRAIGPLLELAYRCRLRNKAGYDPDKDLVCWSLAELGGLDALDLLHWLEAEIRHYWETPVDAKDGSKLPPRKGKSPIVNGEDQNVCG